MEHPDQTPAFTFTVRTPQSRHTVWEINPCIEEWCSIRLNMIQFKGLKFNANFCKPALRTRKSGSDDMDAKTILVNRDIVYKEGRRRDSYHRRRRSYHRRRYDAYGYGGDGRRRSQGQKRGWKVCLVDIGCADGLRLTPLLTSTCPSPQEVAALPRCQGSGAGELCIANKGECFVPTDLRNCGGWYGRRFSVYQKATGTTRTSTTYTRTSTVGVVGREVDAEAFQLEGTTIAALVVAGLFLGGIALTVLLAHLRDSQKAASPDDGYPAI